MATGYTVPPTSKLPFLNIITDVLFMHVPIKKEVCSLPYCHKTLYLNLLIALSNVVSYQLQLY